MDERRAARAAPPVATDEPSPGQAPRSNSTTAERLAFFGGGNRKGVS